MNGEYKTPQLGMFGPAQDEPEEVWEGLPPLQCENIDHVRKVSVFFRTEAAYQKFRELIGAANLACAGGLNTDHFWFPAEAPHQAAKFEWIGDP